MANDKAIIHLSTGQKFECPVANIPNVKRIYKEKIVKIEYPDEATKEAAQEQEAVKVEVEKKSPPPVKEEVAADISIFDEQKKAIKAELEKVQKEKQELLAEREKISNEWKQIQEEKAKLADAVKSGPADYSKSKERLSRANLKDKSLQELRDIIKGLGTGFKSTARKELEDHIIINQKTN